MKKSEMHTEKVSVETLRRGKEVWDEYAIAIGDSPETSTYERHDQALFESVAKIVGSRYWNRENAQMKALHAEAKYRINKQAYEQFAKKTFAEHDAKFELFTPSNAEIFDLIEHELMLDKTFFASFFMGKTKNEFNDFVYSRQLKYRKGETIRHLKHDMKEVARFKRMSKLRELAGLVKKEQENSVVGYLSENGFASYLFNLNLKPGESYQIQFG